MRGQRTNELTLRTGRSGRPRPTLVADHAADVDEVLLGCRALFERGLAPVGDEVLKREFRWRQTFSNSGALNQAIVLFLFYGRAFLQIDLLSSIILLDN